jgi:hypothetical protein
LHEESGDDETEDDRQVDEEHRDHERNSLKRGHHARLDPEIGWRPAATVEVNQKQAEDRAFQREIHEHARIGEDQAEVPVAGAMRRTPGRAGDEKPRRGQQDEDDFPPPCHEGGTQPAGVVTVDCVSHGFLHSRR